MRLFPGANGVCKRTDRIRADDFRTVRRFEIELIVSFDISLWCMNCFDRVVAVLNPRDDADFESERLTTDFKEILEA